ncbi:MAG: FAD-dependent thymidylate synthase [Gammaproteobacteria bacterium SHHR-1]
MIEVEGKGGIRVKVLADSIANDVRLTTMQLRYPRFILAELNTHRMFSRSSASSRAIPIKKIMAQVQDDPAHPAHWGKNQPGMQAREELDDDTKLRAIQQWRFARIDPLNRAEALAGLGLAKQVVNRLLEPWQYAHTVVSATEWGNFFHLRLHEDAQPEMYELAKAMAEAMERNNCIQHLRPGQWHLPYVSHAEEQELGAGTAIRCSVARCARVSFKNHDQSDPDPAKDVELANKLLAAGHWSPWEHAATPVARLQADVAQGALVLERGTTHMDRHMHQWSGNFCGWVQARHLFGEKT